MTPVRQRSRKMLHAALVGLVGATFTWISAYARPGELVCIRQETLVWLGVAIGGASRLIGVLTSRERHPDA